MFHALKYSIITIFIEKLSCGHQEISLGMLIF
jgi:hypothetical protein